MTTTLTARRPEDLLAAVPLVLGFRPCDSLVMLTFGAPGSFHARVDLPPAAELAGTLPGLVEALLAPALRHRITRVAFVAYTDDAALTARMCTTLRRAFGRAGIGVLEVLRVHGGAWSRVPADAGERETAPMPYDDTNHPFVAQAVFDGRVTHPSREALRDTVARSPGAVVRVTEIQSRPDGQGAADPGWVRDLVTRCATTGLPADDAEAARALAAVVRVDVRDAALYAVTRDTAAAHLMVWADLLRRAPDAQVPDAAALTAFCAWQSGHGALAWCALDRCFDLDPDHGLGRCLAECLTRAVPPSAWEGGDDR